MRCLSSKRVVKGTQDGAQASQSGLAKGPVRYAKFLAVFCEQKLARRNQKIIEKFAVAGSHLYHQDQIGVFVFELSHLPASLCYNPVSYRSGHRDCYGQVSVDRE